MRTLSNTTFISASVNGRILTSWVVLSVRGGKLAAVVQGTSPVEKQRCAR